MQDHFGVAENSTLAQKNRILKIALQVASNRYNERNRS